MEPIDIRRSWTPLYRKKYIVKCLDMITYTTVKFDPAEVDRQVDGIRSKYNFKNIIVDLGIQWRLATGKTIAVPLVSTIQLCVNSYCLVYQVLHAKYPFPVPLSNFLGDDDITFVVARYNIDRPIYVIPFYLYLYKCNFTLNLFTN